MVPFVLKYSLIYLDDLNNERIHLLTFQNATHNKNHPRERCKNYRLQIPCRPSLSLVMATKTKQEICTRSMS